MFYLGYKYKAPDCKIPQKYSFLVLEASTFPFEMPLRLARKFLLALALLLGSLQTQVISMMTVNLVFFLFYLCYRPAKSQVTNTICMIVEAGYIII
jgi:hypothetical protein